MGVVHAARDTSLGRDVALKELQPELATDPRAAARLAREAAITSRLDHPGIVAVHDVGRLPDGRPFYTMRLVRGQTLAQVAADAPSGGARRQLVRHVLAAAEAVAAAHEQGIVHRDLKPANVLVGPHGETQVADWGLATPIRSALARWADLPGVEASGPAGTASFMSPEQARGDAPDPRHDTWSLGATLASVLGGRAELPPELGAIVARAMHPDPASRYADAAAFADDLLRWFEGRQVAAYTYSPAELLRRTLTAYRLPLTVGAVGIGVVALAVGVGWWQTTRSLARASLAEERASSALADLQLERAVEATKLGDRERAERLALAVLNRRDDPLARGVFAAFGRAERPTRLDARPGPECAWSALADDGAFVICGRAGTIERWEPDHVAWTADVQATGGRLQGTDVVTWDGGGGTRVLDAGSGALVGAWQMGGWDWMPETAPRKVWSDTGAFPHADTPPSPCPGSLRVVATALGGAWRRRAATGSSGSAPWMTLAG